MNKVIFWFLGVVSAHYYDVICLFLLNALSPRFGKLNQLFIAGGLNGFSFESSSGGLVKVFVSQVSVLSLNERVFSWWFVETVLFGFKVKRPCSTVGWRQAA